MTARRTAPDARLAALCANRALLGVAAVAAGFGALTAACSPTAGRPGAAPRPAAPDAAADAALAVAGATGPAVPVWRWTRGFIDGDPGAAPLAHSLTWVAPLGAGGSPSGTVTARQDPAGVVRAVDGDDDAGLARALRTLTPGDTLVRDGSDWLVVTGDRVRALVHPVGRLPREAATGDAPADDGVTVAEHRNVLVARRATAPVARVVPIGAAPDDDVPGDRAR